MQSVDDDAGANHSDEADSGEGTWSGITVNGAEPSPPSAEEFGKLCALLDEAKIKAKETMKVSWSTDVRPEPSMLSPC